MSSWCHPSSETNHCFPLFRYAATLLHSSGTPHSTHKYPPAVTCGHGDRYRGKPFHCASHKSIHKHRMCRLSAIAVLSVTPPCLLLAFAHRIFEYQNMLVVLYVSSSNLSIIFANLVIYQCKSLLAFFSVAHYNYNN